MLSSSQADECGQHPSAMRASASDVNSVSFNNWSSSRPLKALDEGVLDRLVGSM
jgi:hypothetical protein